MRLRIILGYPLSSYSDISFSVHAVISYASPTSPSCPNCFVARKRKLIENLDRILTYTNTVDLQAFTSQASVKEGATRSFSNKGQSPVTQEQEADVELSLLGGRVLDWKANEATVLRFWGSRFTAALLVP